MSDPTVPEAKDVATIPAIVYAAKSTLDVRGSLGTQIEGCTAAIKREGRVLYATPCVDDGFSAWKANRGPGLADAKRLAVEAASRHGHAELWVEHSDRLARGDGLAAAHLGEIYFEMRRQGVRLRSVQDDANLEDVIRAVLIGERNSEDSRRKSLAVQNGMRRRAERGQPNGGRAPLGYRWKVRMPGEPGGYEVVPHEAAIVRRIFTEFAAGKSQKQIARDLISDGVPAARSEWHQGTISLMLRSPAYSGRRSYKGEILPGRADWEPIVDEALWDRVATLREAAARTKGRGRGRPSAGTHLFVRGLLKCGECGGAMVPRTIKPRSRTGRLYEAYLCLNRIRDKDSCLQTPVPRRLVDEGVERHVVSTGIDIEASIAAIAEAMDSELTEAETMLAESEREEARAGDRLTRVRRDYQDGRLDAEDWREQRQELIAQQNAAAASAARLRRQRDEVAARRAHADAESELLHALADIRQAVLGEIREAVGIDAIRAALTRLFSHFVLHRVDSPNMPEHPGLYSDLVVPGPFIIEPHARPEAIEGYTCKGLVPLLRREPLGYAGNKDGIGRPFHYEELVWRIRAVLRRAGPRSPGVIEAGRIRVDQATRVVTVAGRFVMLTGREYELLVMLAREPTRVFTKEELLRDVWGFRSVGRTRTLDSHASRLRRRLEVDGETPYVLNEWGVGYRLMLPGS